MHNCFLLIALFCTLSFGSSINRSWVYTINQGLNAFFGSPNYADLDNDGDQEIICGNRNKLLYAWHHDGKFVSGWPVTAGGPIITSPAIGDISNDGSLEVVVYANDGYIYCFGKNGKPVPGWPVVGDEGDFDSTIILVSNSVSLADINNDSYLEIIYTSTRNASVQAFDKNGNSLPGWPVFLEARENIHATPCIIDLDNDGYKEIIVSTLCPRSGDEGDESYNTIYALKYDGATIPEWPKKYFIPSPYNWGPIWSMVAGDINNDNQYELIVSDLMNLMTFNKNGEFFRYPTNGTLSHHCLNLIDIDNDNKLEIIVSAALLYAFDHDLTLMEGFPITDCPKPTGFVVADIDNNGALDIGASTSMTPNTYNFFDFKGKKIENPFLDLGLKYVETIPVVGDFNNDGFIEMAIGDFNDETDTSNFAFWELKTAKKNYSYQWGRELLNQYNDGCVLKNANSINTSLAGTVKKQNKITGKIVYMNHGTVLNPSAVIMNLQGRKISSANHTNGAQGSRYKNIGNGCYIFRMDK
jgi:hypothetical protein